MPFVPAQSPPHPTDISTTPQSTDDLIDEFRTVLKSVRHMLSESEDHEEEDEEIDHVSDPMPLDYYTPQKEDPFDSVF